MKKEKEIDVDEQKKMLTLFILIFPTVLIISVGLLLFDEIRLDFLGVSLIMFFYQFVVMRHFINSYFK